MKTEFQLAAMAVLLGANGLSQATLISTTGPISFGGSASVTAQQDLPNQGGASGPASLTNSNNGAAVANVSVNQFNPASGVLTGVDLQLSSDRTQTIRGSGYKNNGAAKTMTGSGLSNAALTAGGASATFATISQTGGSCSLATGGTGFITCTWGPSTSAPTATNATASVSSANLNDYVGAGTVNPSLSAPNLSATTQQNERAGQASGSLTTYTVNWNGTLRADYSYLLHAAGSFDPNSAQNTLTLDFGTVLQSSNAPSLAFSVSNLADSNRTGLDLDSIAGSGDTGAFDNNLAGFLNLSQGSSNQFLASMRTGRTGSFRAQYILNLSDADVGASATWGNQQLTLNLVGNVSPVPVPAVTHAGLLALVAFVLWFVGQSSLKRAHQAARPRYTAIGGARSGGTPEVQDI